MFFSEYVLQYEPSGSVAEVVRLEEKPWQGEPATQAHIPPCWETDQWRRQRERPVSGP
jgi:hypothetical protein